MATTLAFDVYGTLIDTHGVVDELRLIIGDDAPTFSQLWRDKQLEYSFRRGLMKDYVDFSVCTRQALDYADALMQHPLTAAESDNLMQVYTRLPAFDDVRLCLQKAEAMNFRLFAFSNGSAQAVEVLLAHAGIGDLFEGIVSVEGVKSFKPNPEVYEHFITATGSNVENCWLVSSNPFDVLGAMSEGWRAAWVQRNQQAQFDPWGVQPTLTIDTLAVLQKKISEVS